MAKKFNSTEFKNWIMFLFALGLLYGMFRRGDEVGPWWTLIIGAMLSLTTLLVAVENIMSLVKRGTGGRSNGPKDTGETKVVTKPDSVDQGGMDLERRDSSDPTEVASRWHVRIPRRRRFHASPV